MNVTIYDANNWFRRRIESDITGKPVSSCFQEVQQKDGFPVIVWDGYNSLESRRKIYPEYKNNRKPAGEDIYHSQKLLRKVLKLGKGISIRMDNFEADDVVAHLAREYQKKGMNVFIESNDEDFAQLGIPMAKDSFKEVPEWIVMFKTIVGDSSDNIKGAKGFGKGTWEKLNNEEKRLLLTVVTTYGKESAERVNQLLEKIEVIPKSAYNWLLDKDNRKQLLDYYKIVNFIPITNEQLIPFTTNNANRPELVKPIFEEFML